MIACQYGHIDIVRMLIQEFGGDVNLQNNVRQNYYAELHMDYSC